MARSQSLSNDHQDERCYSYTSHHRNRRFNSAPSRQTQAQTNEMLSIHHSTLYHVEASQMSTIYLSDSGDSWGYSDDDIYDFGDYDEEEVMGRWHLRLPIHSNIALRRALDRGDDPFQIQRQQKSQLHHEMEMRNGPLRNINTTFGEVNFEDGLQHHSRMARILAGEPISPQSLPRVDQMNLREYEDVHGKLDLRANTLWIPAENSAHIIANDFDLVDHSYVPTLSAPVEEGVFSEDPFKGRPETAHDFHRDTPADRYDRF